MKHQYPGAWHLYGITLVPGTFMAPLQKIWDKAGNSARSGKQLRVEVQRKGSKEPWEFVRFVDEVKTKPPSQ
jgi:hypothetical protein